MKAKQNSERGQAMIMIVFGFIGIVAMVALTVDGGNVFLDRRQAQNAADTAAYAAALANLNSQSISQAGLGRAADNGFNNDGVSSTVTVNNPPIAGCGGVSSPYAGDNQYIQVIINSFVDPYFAQIIGINQMENCVESIVRARPAYVAPLFDGHAVVGLAPTGCSVSLQGNTDTIINLSGLFTNSNFCNNSGSVELTTPYLNVVGTAYYNQNATINTTINYNQTRYPYPPVIDVPTPTCSGSYGNVDWTGDADTKTRMLTPGIVNGNFPPNLGGGQKVVALQSGIYCITGNVSLNDDLQGAGILLYVPNGSVSANGNGTLNLSAMTTGPYADMLIYAPITNNSSFTINGSSSNSYTGTILAPGANVTINGSSGTFALNSQIVAYTVTFSGSSEIRITYNDGDNYDESHPAAIELTR